MRVPEPNLSLPVADVTEIDHHTPPSSGHHPSKRRGGNTRAIAATSEKCKRKAKTLKKTKARELALSKTHTPPVVVTSDDMLLQFHQSITDGSDHPTVSASWCSCAPTGDLITGEYMKIQNAGYSGAHSSPSTPLYNKSSHSTLTSTCRVATSYSNASNERFEK